MLAAVHMACCSLQTRQFGESVLSLIDWGCNLACLQNLLCLACVHLVCRALTNAGVSPDDVNYVNAHATSTKAGDLAEYRAITTALPSKHLRINSTKSMIGHLLGAAGAVEAIATVQAIRTGAGQGVDACSLSDSESAASQAGTDAVISKTLQLHQSLAAVQAATGAVGVFQP